MLFENGMLFYRLNGESLNVQLRKEVQVVWRLTNLFLKNRKLFVHVNGALVRFSMKILQREVVVLNA